MPDEISKTELGWSKMSLNSPSKRQFIKTAVYVAPAILTLKVAPSFASTGSGRGPRDDGPGNGNPGRDENPGNGGEDRGGNSDMGQRSSGPQGYRKKKRNWWWPFS